jgi:hypothetical protein
MAILTLKQTQLLLRISELQGAESYQLTGYIADFFEREFSKKDVVNSMLGALKRRRLCYFRNKEHKWYVTELGLNQAMLSYFDHTGI